jgi:hypothetical protein
MAAKDYKLCVSAFGTVYIAKSSKRNQNQMTDDRIEVQKGEFVKAIAEWLENQELKDGILTITCQDKPIIEIKKL